MTDDTGPANGPGHNTPNRSKIMSDALSEMYVLDGKVQAALDKHVAPFREQKKDIKKMLNKDLNVTSDVFQAIYGAYKVAAEANENEDESTLDTLREFFESAAIGHQMDAFADGAEKE